MGVFRIPALIQLAMLLSLRLRALAACLWEYVVSGFGKVGSGRSRRRRRWSFDQVRLVPIVMVGLDCRTCLAVLCHLKGHFGSGIMALTVFAGSMAKGAWSSGSWAMDWLWAFMASARAQVGSR